MAHEFYIDYDESGAAATRFASKATELAAAASKGAGGSRAFPVDDPSTSLDDLLVGPLKVGMDVVVAADDILAAVAGRLDAFSLELDALSKLVKDTIKVTNEIDVEYQL